MNAMKMPGFTAEVVFFSPAKRYLQNNQAECASINNEVYPAAMVRDGVCSMLGGKGKTTSRSCGPFGWFTCEDWTCQM